MPAGAFGAIRGQGEIVRKVKHSSVRIENPLSALYWGTEYFSLARTFRTGWGGDKNENTKNVKCLFTIS